MDRASCSGQWAIDDRCAGTHMPNGIHRDLASQPCAAAAVPARIRRAYVTCRRGPEASDDATLHDRAPYSLHLRRPSLCLSIGADDRQPVQAEAGYGPWMGRQTALIEPGNIWDASAPGWYVRTWRQAAHNACTRSPSVRIRRARSARLGVCPPTAHIIIVIPQTACTKPCPRGCCRARPCGVWIGGMMMWSNSKGQETRGSGRGA